MFGSNVKKVFESFTTGYGTDVRDRLDVDVHSICAYLSAFPDGSAMVERWGRSKMYLDGSSYMIHESVDEIRRAISRNADKSRPFIQLPILVEGFMTEAHVSLFHINAIRKNATGSAISFDQSTLSVACDIDDIHELINRYTATPSSFW